jgi:hypothetical protein
MRNCNRRSGEDRSVTINSGPSVSAIAARLLPAAAYNLLVDPQLRQFMENI